MSRTARPPATRSRRCASRWPSPRGRRTPSSSPTTARASSRRRSSRRRSRAASVRGVPVLVDPKLPHAERYRGATLVTPNHHEAELMTAITIRTPDDARRAARQIHDRTGANVADHLGRARHVAARRLGRRRSRRGPGGVRARSGGRDRRRRYRAGAARAEPRGRRVTGRRRPAGQHRRRTGRRALRPRRRRRLRTGSRPRRHGARNAARPYRPRASASCGSRRLCSLPGCIVATKFESVDPDSVRYAIISSKLSATAGRAMGGAGVVGHHDGRRTLRIFPGASGRPVSDSGGARAAGRAGGSGAVHLRRGAGPGGPPPDRIARRPIDVAKRRPRRAGAPAVDADGVCLSHSRQPRVPDAGLSADQPDRTRWRRPVVAMAAARRAWDLSAACSSRACSWCWC